jgi:hypothetical protein
VDLARIAAVTFTAYEAMGIQPWSGVPGFDQRILFANARLSGT